MEVILRKEIFRLGKIGDVVTVKDGYARNFLIPRGFALQATPGSLKLIEEEKRINQLRVEREFEEVKKLAERLENVSCTVRVKTGEDDKLFGSVTNADIARAFEAEDIHIDKKKICLDQPIKATGVFRVPIKLHPEVKVDVKVWVVKE